MKQSKFARLSAGVSVMALGVAVMGFALPAVAQTTTGEADVTEVIVTGQRAQVKTAQKLKRDAESVVDSITATDIGALPDRSVSEALQRVAGITLQRTDAARDPARLSGEGGAIFVRGLSYVSTLLNGREVFSAKNGRSIGFEDVSADLMAGVDVYKSTVAEQIEGALGGTVNLRTRLPFDSKKRIIAFTADRNYGDLRDEAFVSGGVTYSDRWETSIGEIGLLLNASVSNVGTRSNAFTTDRFDQVAGVGTTSKADDRYAPKAAGYRTIDWDQKREAVAAAAQWRPTDSLEFTLQYLNTKATPKSLERSTGYSDNLLSPNSSYTYDSQGQFTGGVFNNTIHRNVTRTGVDNKETSDISLGGKWRVSERLTLSAEAQKVKSTSKVVSFTVGTELMDQVDVKLDLYGSDTPTFLTYNNCFRDCTVTSSALANVNDPTRYLYNFAMDHLEDNDAEQTAYRVDASYEFDSAWLRSLKGGIRVADKTATTRENGYNWGAVSQDAAWNGNNVTKDPPISGMIDYYNYGDFFRGGAQQPAGGVFPSVQLADYYASRDKIKTAAADLGWGWVPFDGNYDAVPPGRADNPTSGSITQSEKTSAVYGVVRFGNDNILSGLDGNVGVRVIKTELSNGQGLLGNPGALANVTAANINPNSSATLRQEVLDAIAISAVGGTVKGIRLENTYTDVLPSLNLRLKATDQIQLRLSLSKAIVRPSFGQMQPYTTLGVTANLVQALDSAGKPIPAPTQTDPTATLQYVTSIEYSGSGGNPSLQPMEANAYDFSAEWYFAPTGSLTLALFKKDLKNYFFGSTGNESYTVGGKTKTYSVFRTRNGDKGSVDGLELAYSQFYDFLPGPLSGLGVQANYTIVNSKGGKNTAVNISEAEQVAGAQADLPLEGLSETSYNVAFMYEKYGISARLAYNWRSEFLMTTSAANIKAPVWSEDYGQWDGSVLYSVTPKIKVGLQVTNLGREKTYLKVGNPDRLARYAWFDTDRRVAITLRGQF
ncbi:TonB-dependent receptor [Asticcacaulis sp.]|uniref:TonB-dependent receptor n=1 Tax=Asticcacaulis sp. TaxID=1872648 RepID=UPI00261683B1|nr:TonB-dependent receptor [Asticcacaulis sp.]